MATRPDTRTRILAAARAEFAARGFAGAREKTIAARARANKRMLYYYLDSTKRLFDAALAAALRECAGGLLMTGDPVSVLVEWYRRVSQAPDLCRLLQWESLEQLRRRAPEARSMADRLKTAVRNAQGRNGVSKECEPEYAALALVAVTVFPVAFPRLAELLTGVAPETPIFGQKHAGLLRTLLREEHLARG